MNRVGYLVVLDRPRPVRRPTTATCSASIWLPRPTRRRGRPTSTSTHRGTRSAARRARSSSAASTGRPTIVGHRDAKIRRQAQGRRAGRRHQGDLAGRLYREAAHRPLCSWRTNDFVNTMAPVSRPSDQLHAAPSPGEDLRAAPRLGLSLRASQRRNSLDHVLTALRRGRWCTRAVVENLASEHAARMVAMKFRPTTPASSSRS